MVRNEIKSSELEITVTILQIDWCIIILSYEYEHITNSITY